MLGFVLIVAFTTSPDSILKNPVVFMTVAGVAGNLIFGGSMPAILNQVRVRNPCQVKALTEELTPSPQFLSTLGSAFSASALFLLGLRMTIRSSTGSSSLGRSGIVTAFILIVVKTVGLPLVAREMMTSLHAGNNHNETGELANFAYLYGTFPTAPAVFVFASQVISIHSFSPEAQR